MIYSCAGVNTKAQRLPARLLQATSAFRRQLGLNLMEPALGIKFYYTLSPGGWLELV